MSDADNLKKIAELRIRADNAVQECAKLEAAMEHVAREVADAEKQLREMGFDPESDLKKQIEARALALEAESKDLDAQMTELERAAGG